MADALAWVGKHHCRTLIACWLIDKRWMVRLCDPGDQRTNRPNYDSAGYGATPDQAAAEAIKGL